MLYSEIIAVCSQIHTEHINTLCGQNVECRTYRAVNTLRLSYKNQPVNAVQWNNTGQQISLVNKILAHERFIVFLM